MSSSDAPHAGWLTGKVALVTGAGAGIGRAVTERFVAEGACVVGLDRDAGRLETLQAGLGASFAPVAGDAATYAANEEAVRAACKQFGRLDVLVANVGVFDWNRRIDDVDPQALSDAFDELFAINVKSHLLAARAAAEPLRAAGGAAIFTCSNASFRAGGGGPLYTASKFAVRGLVLQLAMDWAPHVRVNGVAPGGTVTQLSGLRSLGTEGRVLAGSERRLQAMAEATPLAFAAAPADHAGLYVTLASPAHSRAVTGAVFVSDGGLTVSV